MFIHLYEATTLAHELIQVLKRMKLLRMHHLHLLLSLYMEKINLSRCSFDITKVLSFTVNRCPNLKHLDISFNDKISRRVFKELFPSLSNLQVLNLSSTTCDDGVLSVIGVYCTQLRDLDVSCCKISDSGIQSLCQSKKEPGEMESRYGNCKKIARLKLLNTELSVDGAVCAITNLPQLKDFEYENTIGALGKMYKNECEKDVNLPRHNLLNLYAVDEDIDDDSILVATTVCPSAEKVHIICFPTFSSFSLLHFIQLKSICELQVQGADSSTVFQETMLPLLQAHGTSMEIVQFQEIYCVNVNVIGYLCPNLTHVSLMLNRSYGTASALAAGVDTKIVEPVKVFQNVQSLRVMCEILKRETYIPGSQLSSLLTSPQLKYIYMFGCASLTDELLQEIVHSHRFPVLEHLELEYCHSVTEKGIGALLKLDNPLRVLKLWNCQNITRKDFVDFQKLAKKKKWDLVVEWM